MTTTIDAPVIEQESKQDTDKERLHSIIVINDDVNSFDWVIKAFVEILGHSLMQAEQLALLVHYTNKAAVKNGDFDTLRPLAEGLIDRGLNATIEER